MPVYDLLMADSEYSRFTTFVDKALSVPKSEIDRRQLEYQKESLRRPARPGPKINQKAALKKLEAR
jgi:hypothetical protein